MNRSIRLSKQYGVNPSISTCYWCGEEKNEIVLFGKIGRGREDIEAPRNVVMDYEPCFQCQKHWRMGIAILEATEEPAYDGQMEIQNGIFPTGRWCVLREEVAERIFGEDAIERGIMLLDESLYEELGLGGAV